MNVPKYRNRNRNGAETEQNTGSNDTGGEGQALPISRFAHFLVDEWMDISLVWGVE
jgi:hypothetical protein